MHNLFKLYFLFFAINCFCLSAITVAGQVSIRLNEAPLNEVLSLLRSELGVEVLSNVEESMPVTLSIENLPANIAIQKIILALGDVGIRLERRKNNVYLATRKPASDDGVGYKETVVSVMNKYKGMTVFQALSKASVRNSHSWNPQASNWPSPTMSETIERSLERLQVWDPTAEWVLNEISLVKVPRLEAWYYKLKFGNTLVEDPKSGSMFCIMAIGTGELGDIEVVDENN